MARGRERIIRTGLDEALSGRYLAYALSTITSRSLPDVRDGLKPVQRRILYAMQQMRLAAGSPPRKSARIVGEVVGRYHPHGDAAIYEALVRMAQDFAARYPLVDGQGNFGNIDGDAPAAMRYTEARLTRVAGYLLDGTGVETVPFRASYDGSGTEPEVLPASFPNLLANGATGIAVGMATSIPPHNAREICDALLLLLERPGASVADLLRCIRGPDFPSGGVIVESPESILGAYETGRGSFRTRACWEREDTGGGGWQIVVTGIPWLLPKARLIEGIAALLEEGRLPLLGGIRDESADTLRVVLTPARHDTDPVQLMESLFRTTGLESRISLNMNVLDQGKFPVVMGLDRVLAAFLGHRRETVLRRSRHRTGEICRRLRILDGLVRAYLNLDEVIRIIREEDDPAPVLMADLSLDEEQAEAILNMRLRGLRRLEEEEISREARALAQEREALETLLASPAELDRVIRGEIVALRKRVSGKGFPWARRTTFGTVPALAAVAGEGAEARPLTVLLSERGWIRAARGHLGPDQPPPPGREGDSELFRLCVLDTDRLLLLADSGRFHTLAVDRLPRRRGFGEPLGLLVDLPGAERIVDMLCCRGGGLLLVASAGGRGFLVDETVATARTKSGKQVLLPAAGDSARLCRRADGDHVAVMGDNRRLLVFPLDGIPARRSGRGVVLQEYGKGGGGLADAIVFSAGEGLYWQAGERLHRETRLASLTGKRGGRGVRAPSGFVRGGRFVHPAPGS